MRVALITSNNLPINNKVKKGTEILFRALVGGLSDSANESGIKLTVFASGDSDLPAKIESIDSDSTSHDPTIPQEKVVIFELALLSKAFSMQDEFDLYNIHIGDGDIALPFVRFTNKPIIITMHHIFDKKYLDKYFSLFRDQPNLFFISLSNAQRRFFPDMNFLNTIYNGINTTQFAYDQNGGKNILWSGRGVPVKGLDTALHVTRRLRKQTEFVIIRKNEYSDWLDKTLELVYSFDIQDLTTINFDFIQEQLVKKYQKSKLFLFPTQLEEACPLSALESMSCGTPVIAYAKGAVPEVIKDGKTGFIVNESDEDIRGNWVIKKTGIDGLCEAVERIYNMNDEEYQDIRKACRKHVEENFTVEKMSENYIEAYKKALLQGA